MTTLDHEALIAHIRACANGTDLLQDGAFQMSARRTIRKALNDAADALSSIPEQGAKPPLHSFRIGGQCNCIACLTVRRDHAEAKEAALSLPSQPAAVGVTGAMIDSAAHALEKSGLLPRLTWEGTCDLAQLALEAALPKGEASDGGH